MGTQEIPGTVFLATQAIILAEMWVCDLYTGVLVAEAVQNSSEGRNQVTTVRNSINKENHRSSESPKSQ